MAIHVWWVFNRKECSLHSGIDKSIRFKMNYLEEFFLSEINKIVSLEHRTTFPVKLHFPSHPIEISLKGDIVRLK